MSYSMSWSKKVNFLLCLLLASRPYSQKVTFKWSSRQRHAIAHFSQCIFLISKMCFSQKSTQPLLRSVRSNGRPRGHRSKKMIFALIFESCWNKPPLFFWFETISNVRPQRPRNGLGKPISKITFMKSLDQMEKNELYFGFVVNKKRKSIFKGGVLDQFC